MSEISPKNNTTIAYTDGACKNNPGPGGWGAYLVFSDGSSIELYAGESETTNNQMEMIATIQAIKHSPENDLLELWTDSSYVKNGITEWIQNWKKNNWKTSNKKPVKNQILWQELDALNQSRNISWNWIKGHAGHYGNEKADQLANQGVLNPSGNLPIQKKTLSEKLKPVEHSTSITPVTIKSQKNLMDASNPTNIPEFNGDTSKENPYFRPLLPKPVNKNKANRQLIMDTETTGFDFNNGDRVIEVGIVEMVGRRFTGEKLHVYINPCRQEPMSEEVIRVHGITDEFLADKPVFDRVAQDIYDFMIGAEVIAHNATFDINFLNMEFDKVGLHDFNEKITVTDSLALAKNQYPGQRNTLDALVRRLNVGKQDRTFHGALLDAEILAEVYLAMTGGQVSLAIDIESSQNGNTTHADFSDLSDMLVASHCKHNHDEWLNIISNKFPNVLKVWNTV